MMRLFSEWGYLESQFGCSIRDHFLMAIRSLDNPKAVTPFLIERAGRRFGLFLHVEKGNVEAAQLPLDITPVYYRPYFTFDNQGPAHATLADALDSIADGDRRIVVDRHAPLAVAAELASRYTVDLEEAPEYGTVTLRKTPLADTIVALGRGRQAASAAARRLLARSPMRDRIASFLDRHEDERFTALDALLVRAGFGAIIVSSTLNVQEIAGVPVWRKQRPLAAIYVPGEPHAWVMEPGRAVGGREFASPEAALRDIAPQGRLGVEIEDVDLGLARALGLSGRDHAPADRLLRQWRDHGTLPDLAYYVIATRASRHAIDAALDHAAQGLRRNAPITEMDSYAVYLRELRGFVASAMPDLRVARTLTNFHSGARTIFPANPAAFPIDTAMNTLKIDAGCMLFDDQGFLLGCSDIARTLALSDDAKQLYAVFQQGVRRAMIPAVRAGRTGEAMHRTGVEAVWNERARLAGNSLFVNLDAPERQYDRDVGHLLGKNNLAHLRLVPGDGGTLREGMIACCEYQWPLRSHAIAYEDTCLVTAERGLNLTSDEE